MKIKRTILFVLLMIISLAGFSCEGPVGADGPEGPQGEQGPVGPAGEDGANMHAGEGEPDAAFGKTGDFYLDLSTGDLFGPKDETDGWGEPISLKGADGEDGKDGEDGNDGADGSDGKDGADGNDGKDGADGNDGKDGADGEDGQDGADGKDGQDGKDGADGSRIFAGDGTPDDSLGKEGDFYLDKSNFLLYGPKTGSGWGTPINLQGPVGPQGPQGEPGPQGPQGPAGEDGEDGNANVIRLRYTGGFDFETDNYNFDAGSASVPAVFLVYLVDVAPAGIDHLQDAYQIPGYGRISSTGAKTEYGVQHRIDTNLNNNFFNVFKHNGLGEMYDEVHIVRINITSGKLTSSWTEAVVTDNNNPFIPDDLDISDYNKVLEFYGITD